MTPADRPHLPRQAPIDFYGNGGFRFAEMSHRGSLLSLPSGIWSWDPPPGGAFDAEALAPVLAEAERIDMLILGTGERIVPLAAGVRALLRAAAIGCETLTTGAAVRTYNIVLGEGRRVAAALVAVTPTAG